MPVNLGSERRRTSLRFEPPPETIDLDRETAAVTVQMRVDRAEPPRSTVGQVGAAPRGSLLLQLYDEHGTLVAEGSTGGDRRAHFEAQTALLDVPGPGELVVRFGGTEDLAPSVAAHRLLRRAEAHVALAVPMQKADPTNGMPIEVNVTTSRGPVRGGVVEVRRLVGATSEPVGAAPVDDKGHARVIVAFAANGASRATLVIAYVTSAEWYRSGSPLRIDAQLAGPSAVPQLLVGALVLAAAIWVASGFRRAPRNRLGHFVDAAPKAPKGRPGIRVLAALRDRTEWRGTVVDAHDGSPVPGAHL